MQVHEGMTSSVLTVGPSHTLRDVARLMAERKVGAAVVMDPDAGGPGIITERDILMSLGIGEDPDVEAVGEHLTREVVYAAPDWSLEDAAAAMVRGGQSKNAQSIVDALKALPPGTPVVLQIQRDQKLLFITFILEQPL